MDSPTRLTLIWRDDYNRKGVSGLGGALVRGKRVVGAGMLPGTAGHINSGPGLVSLGDGDALGFWRDFDHAGDRQGIVGAVAAG